MNNIVDYNLIYSMGIIFLGYWLFSILNTYSRVENFHSRSFAKNIIHQILTVNMNNLKNLQKAKYSHISLESFLLHNVINIGGFITIYYSVMVIMKEAQLNASVVLFFYLINVLLVAIFYKRENILINQDVEFLNVIYCVAILSMNLYVTEGSSLKAVSILGNIVSLFISYYVLFYVFKSVFSKTMHLKSSMVLKLFLISMGIMIAVFYKKYIGVEIINNELLEVVILGFMLIVIIYYIINSQINQSVLVKNKILIKSVFKISVVLTIIRLVLWNI